MSPMTRTLPRRGAGAVATLVLCLALLPALLADDAQAQPTRIGDVADPALAAVAISQATHGDGQATHAVIGRDDVFADNLAATALAGTDGTLLFTTRGTAPLRPEVADELRRALGERTCTEGDRADVYLAGGTSALGEGIERAVAGMGYCVQRLGGPDRIATAILVADAVPDPSPTVVLARADDWADAASVGAWAAATGSRVLVTGGAELDERVAAALQRYAPEEVLLVGGPAALSEQVLAEVAEIAPLRRIAGPARDGTAVAVAEEVWGDTASGGYLVGHGYAGTAWTSLFAAAPLGGRTASPVLYATDEGPTPTSQDLLDDATDEVVAVGPVVPPDETVLPILADLSTVAVDSEVIAGLSNPMVLVPRPDVPELWVAERAGRVQVLGPDGARLALDISPTVSTGGERGLLGMDLSPDGRTLYTSSTDNGGASVIDAFDVVDGAVDDGSRRQLIRVPQPASNHNGGDLHVGPDGYLWWSLGDGGGSNDTYGNGQRPDTLLGTLVRIDPVGGQPYAIPPDNPFVDGGGAAEVWAWGLRNPFRISFDPMTDDLWIADVGQGAREEIDFLPAGAGAGANFGWPIFEGTLDGPGPNRDIAHVPPIHERSHSQGDCSITGGVVYRGSAIPELFGAYLYSDFCNDQLRAVVQVDGEVTQVADLGVRLGSPVGFGVGHDGEVYVLDLGGSVHRLVPG